MCACSHARWTQSRRSSECDELLIVLNAANMHIDDISFHVWALDFPRQKRKYSFSHPLSVSFSLPLCASSRWRSAGTEVRDMWLDDHKARWAEPANQLAPFPLFQNPHGWLSVSSTRTPSCLHTTHWCSDAMSSLGDLQCMIMLKDEIQRAARAPQSCVAKKKKKSFVEGPNPVTASDFKHEQ